MKIKHPGAWRPLLFALAVFAVTALPAQAGSIKLPLFVGGKAPEQVQRLRPAEWGRMRELNPVVFDRANLRPQTGCLAVALYHEARGENELGQIAVAQVILNRVWSSKYPDTVCAVVFQNSHLTNRCQFSFACDGRSDEPRNARSWRKMRELARAIMCGEDCRYHARNDPALARLAKRFKRASHYHATRVQPFWSSKLSRSGRIGRHIFYISKRVMG